MDASARDLIARYVTEASEPGAEIAQFLTLAEDKQEIVLTRLLVIDRYLRLTKPTAHNADRAADELKMGRSNFYRLVDKLRAHGPVAGLTPGFRLKKRFSSASEGLGDVAELAILKTLEDDPTANLAEIQSAVADACDSARVSRPSPALVRRRLNRIQSTAGLRVAEPGERRIPRFGRSLLVDQCATSLVVQMPGSIEHAVATMIVDIDTRLVCGVALASSLSTGSGLYGVLDDLAERQPKVPVGSFKMNERLEQIHWVVPSGMEDFAFPWAQNMSSADVAGTFDSVGDRRHGRRLLRLLGSPFGSYELLPRRTSSPAVASAKPASGVEPSVARHLLGMAVDEWNYDIVRIRMRAVRASTHEEKQRQLKRWMSTEPWAASFGREIQMLFKAALTASTTFDSADPRQQP